MDVLSSGLVYATYTIYLLLVIVGFLTKVDMPAIANLTLATNYATPTPASVTLVPMSAIPSKEASWSTTDYPEQDRKRINYSLRKADPGTGLVRHTWKITLPTMKSVVTDPSGPYAPPPQLDYVTVAEVSFYIHARATVIERQAAIAAVLKSDKVDSTFADAIYTAVAGQTFY